MLLDQAIFTAKRSDEVASKSWSDAIEFRDFCGNFVKLQLNRHLLPKSAEEAWTAPYFGSSLPLNRKPFVKSKILRGNALRSFPQESYWHLLLLAVLILAPLPAGVLIWDLFGDENNRKQSAESRVKLTPLNIVTPYTQTATFVTTFAKSDFEHFPVYGPIPPVFDYIVAGMYNSDLATEESEAPSEGPDQASAAQPDAGSTSVATTAQLANNNSGNRSSVSAAPDVRDSDTSINPVRSTVVQAIPEGSSTGVLFALGLAALFGISVAQRKRANPSSSRP